MRHRSTIPGSPTSLSSPRIAIALVLSLVASSLMASIPPAVADPWTEWRGDPQHTSPTSGDAPPEKGELIWTYQTGDQVLSSPVFYDGGMLVGSDDGWLYCLDPVSGSLNWKFRTDGPIQATALVAGDRAYFGSFDGEFYCISLPAPGSGAQPGLIWNFTCTDQIISSAHIYEGRVYFADLSGTVHCLTVEGARVWSEKVSEREIWATPALDPARGMLYIGDIGRGLYGLSMATGKVEKSLMLTDRTEIYSSVALHDDVLYVCTGEERELLCIDPDDLGIIWGFDCDDPCYSTPNIQDGMVHFSSYRYLWCVPSQDPNGDGNITMDEMAWSTWMRGFQGGSSPLVADGRVFVGSDDEDYRMYCIDATDGSELWNVSAMGYIYSSPSLFNGSIYFGSSDRSIYCVGERPPGIEIGLTLDKEEVLSNSTVRLDVLLTDGDGNPVPGASVEFVLSAGAVSLDGRDPWDGGLTADDEGRLTVHFLPPPVSSRSTVVISMEAAHPGLASARTSFSLVVEPAEGEGADSGFVYKDPDRPLYIAGFIALLLLNAALLSALVGLSSLFRKVRREAGR